MGAREFILRPVHGRALSLRLANRLLWLGVCAFALTWALRALARYQSFHNHTFDLAFYARLSWGMLRADGWDPVLGTPFLGGHMAFVLAPLGAVGALLGTVPVLLVSQALALSLTAVPLARFGERRLGPWGILLGAFSFWLFPNLSHVASYEFHPGSFALPALAFALDALDRDRPRATLAWALPIVLCRADFSLLTAMLGLLALLLPGRSAPLRRSGALLLGLSVAYFFGATALQLQHARQVSSADLHFGVWGGSPLGVVRALVTEPARVLSHFGQPARLAYPFKILLPLALLPLLRPRWLLPALPFVAINLISDFPTTTKLYSHYLTPAVPALVAAALDGLTRAPQGARWLLPVSSLVASVIAGGAPWSLDNPAQDFRPDARTHAARRIRAHIAAGASVQAPDFMLPHFVERRVVHRAPPPERATRYVILDVSHRQRFAGREVLLRTSEEPIARHWLARVDHGLVAAEPDELLLFERGASPRGALLDRYRLPAAPARGPGQPLSACLTLLGARLLHAQLELHLQATGPCPKDLALRLGEGERPARVELLFDGLLSPAQLRAGERLRSTHALNPQEQRAALSGLLRMGLLRSSGAPPDKGDPVSLPLPLQ